MNDSKPSNPKSIIGSSKAQLSNVPWTLMVCAARAFLEGALKYGRFNWRIAGVSATTYLDALKRHVAKWENGQNYDKKTRVHHLDNAIACLAILRDAELYGMLTDDRPPCPDPDRMAELIDSEGELIAHLKYEFRDHAPKQYTIADTPRKDAGEVPAGTPRAVHGRDAMAAGASPGAILREMFRDVDGNADRVQLERAEAERIAAEREALRVNAEIDVAAELPLRHVHVDPGSRGWSRPRP